jgi:hypothetical protein
VPYIILPCTPYKRYVILDVAARQSVAHPRIFLLHIKKYTAYREGPQILCSAARVEQQPGREQFSPAEEQNCPMAPLVAQHVCV